MKILITGGLGFVGTHVIHDLLPRGVAIRVLDIRPKPWPSIPLDPRVELIAGDVCDADIVDRAADGMDAIIHLAAETGVVQSLEDPQRSCRVNIGGTVNILEAARRVGARVVFASSNAVLGGAVPADEATLPHPTSPYGATKLAGEALCTGYAESFGLQTTALRFSNVYGTHALHKGSAVAAILTAALRRGRVVVTGDGSQTRDFLHAPDLARAVWLALERAPAGSVFQIASGVETSIGEVAGLIAALVFECTGRVVAIDHEPARRGDVPRNVSRIDKAQRLLGYQHTTSLEAGLRATLAWFIAAMAERRLAAE